MTESEAPEIHTEEKPHWSDHWRGVPWHKVFFICLLLGGLIQILSDTAIVLLGDPYTHVADFMAKLVWGGLLLSVSGVSIEVMLSLFAEDQGRKIIPCNQRPYNLILKVVAFTFFGSIMFSLLYSAINSARLAVHNQQNTQAPWVTHLLGGDQFVVQVPESWQKNELSTDYPGSVYLSDSHNDLHLVVAATPKIDVNFNSLEEAIQAVIKMQSAGLEQVQTEEPHYSQVGPFNAADTILKGSLNKTNLTFQIRVLDYGGTWVQSTLWATPSQYTKYQALFLQIRDSIGAAPIGGAKPVAISVHRN